MRRALVMIPMTALAFSLISGTIAVVICRRLGADESGLINAFSGTFATVFSSVLAVASVVLGRPSPRRIRLHGKRSTAKRSRSDGCASGHSSAEGNR
jgi:hypothetical protein